MHSTWQKRRLVRRLKELKRRQRCRKGQLFVGLWRGLSRPLYVLRDRFTGWSVLSDPLRMVEFAENDLSRFRYPFGLRVCHQRANPEWSCWLDQQQRKLFSAASITMYGVQPSCFARFLMVTNRSSSNLSHLVRYVELRDIVFFLPPQTKASRTVRRADFAKTSIARSKDLHPTSPVASARSR